MAILKPTLFPELPLFAWQNVSATGRSLYTRRVNGTMSMTQNRIPEARLAL